MLPLLRDGALDDAARRDTLVVIPGLSTVPALSGMLTRWCLERVPGAETARITLFIGNRNAKGAAAIASAFDSGFTDPRPVLLPLGRHTAYRFRSPDAALLRRKFGLTAEFRAAFEWEMAGRLMAVIAPRARRLAPVWRRRLARGLSVVAAPLNRYGADLGCLQVEVEAGGRSARAALIGAGQRLAILPAALAIEALLSGELQQRGVLDPSDWLEPDAWLQRLARRGVRFESSLP